MPYPEPWVPWVPMRLFHGKKATRRLPVLIDSGADFAFFSAELAPRVGIPDFKTGKKLQAGGLGEANYWLHEGLGVSLIDAEGNKAAIRLNVGFIPKFPIHGVVGRQHFFQAFDISISESERRIVLDLRDDATNTVDPNDVPVDLPPIPLHKQSRRAPSRRKAGRRRRGGRR